MKKDRADIAIRLVEERTRLRYSQADFADKAGISREGLRLYETGQRGMSADFLIEAASLGADVQYVLAGLRSTNWAGAEDAPPHQSAPVNAGNVVNFQARTSGNVVGQVHPGGTVHQVHTQKHITRTVAKVTPGGEHITEEQAACLRGLVDQIVEKESLLKAKPRTHRSVWAALNAHCRVTSYRLIPAADYAHARKYLDQWMGRLGSMATAPIKDGDEWRKRRYAYIKINSKSPEDEQALLTYIKRNFNAASLTALDNSQLEQVYRYIAGRRSKARKT